MQRCSCQHELTGREVGIMGGTVNLADGETVWMYGVGELSDFTMGERGDARVNWQRPARLCSAHVTMPSGAVYGCTRPVGHADVHAAGTGSDVAASWGH